MSDIQFRPLKFGVTRVALKDGAPGTRAAFDHFASEHGGRTALAAVFFGDVFVRRADQFFVNRMASHAVLGLGQGLVCLGVDTKACGQQGRDQRGFHAFY
jgi:hypothetical protein